jgi:enamine deaminase RidA (YjgF/YER057c/UK114 family)
VQRQNFSSGTEWEPKVGYSRAVRVGQFIFVSGTTATAGTGEVVAPGGVYEQTIQALENVRRALHQAGGRLEDVVRTRIYTTRIDDWQAIGRAHALFFGDIRPASSMVEVSRLISPAMLVEIEADALMAG